MRWLVAVLALLALVAAIVAFAGPRIVQDVVDDRVAALEADVAAATGGDVEVDLSTSTVETVRRALADEPPAGVVVVTDGQLPDGGVRFRRAEVLVGDADGPGTLTLWLPPAAIEEQIGIDGVEVAVADAGLELQLGPVTVPVRARVVDGSVALDVPGLPAPFDELVEDELTDLVPAPPDGVVLTDVAVAGGELVVVGAVDLDVFVAALRDAA